MPLRDDPEEPVTETPAEDDIPTDEQMHEWFPKLFARIDEELAEIEGQPS